MELLRYNLSKNEKWIDLINYKKIINDNFEKEYESDCDNEDNSKNNINYVNFSIDNEKILNEINKIISITNFGDYNSLDLLKKEDLITTYLTKSIVQNNNKDTDFIINNLVWLKKCSAKLAKRLKQKLIHHNIDNLKKNKIIRSSYKFCSFKNNCNYNYNKNKKCCYADHYVHNLVYADLDVLIKYISLNKTSLYNKEVIKCVNTISFVIKHMYEELDNLCLYELPKNYEKFHIINYKKYKNKKVSKKI